MQLYSDSFLIVQNMAVQNELLNLLQAESEATVVYAAIVLSQVFITYVHNKSRFSKIDDFKCPLYL